MFWLDIVGVNKLNKSFYLRIERLVRKGPELSLIVQKLPWINYINHHTAMKNSKGRDWWILFFFRHSLFFITWPILRLLSIIVLLWVTITWIRKAGTPHHIYIRNPECMRLNFWDSVLDKDLVWLKVLNFEKKNQIQKERSKSKKYKCCPI